MSELEQRVANLERQNGRLQFGLAAVVALMLAVPLVGALMPQEIPEMIEARAFRVVGENETVRTEMSTTGIFYYDENGAVRVWKRSAPRGLAINYDAH